MLIEWEIRASGDVGLNRRMIGRFKGDSPYLSGYAEEELATVDKMSMVVIEYF